MPLFSPKSLPSGPGSFSDGGEAGFLPLLFTALTGYPGASAYSGSISSGSVCGSAWNALDILGPSSTTQGGNLVAQQINSPPLSAGVQLSFNRGVLTARGAFVS